MKTREITLSAEEIALAKGDYEDGTEQAYQIARAWNAKARVFPKFRGADYKTCVWHEDGSTTMRARYG